MGVLDDAIRSHLELKRKHGASEEEVTQQEQDALGSARRAAADEPAPETVGDEEPPADDAPAVETEPELEADPEPEAEPEPEPEAEPEPEPEIIESLPGVPDPEPERSDPAQDADDDEDVLEDTPEFLQDTPEHDRLWFEQKPPRDFDFDE